MKVLFLATRFPFPTTKGDQLRVVNFLQQLVDQGYQVDFVCSAEDTRSLDQHWSKFPSGINKVVVCGYGRFERYYNLLRPIFSFQPFQVAYFYNRQMNQQIQALVQENNYQAIICQMVRSAPYVGKLDVFKIIDFQDAYSLNMYKRYESEVGLVKWVSWLEWHLLAKYEKRLIKRFDKTFIISERDRRVIGHSEMAVINNGVDMTEVRVDKVPQQIVFSGNLQYFPNREAIVWFTKKVFPLIRRKLPQATLKITGATPPVDVLELEQVDGVTVAPNPTNMAAQIATAEIAIAPMLSGSGLQNKVLEAMAVGLPVVLSKHALEGLNSSAQSAVACSSLKPQDLAQLIVDLLNDQPRQKQMRQAGLRYIQRYHSWHKVGQQLDQMLQEAKISSQKYDDSLST